MSKWYAATEMTGVPESLDNVPDPGDFTDLSTGDKCFVLVGNLHLRIYEYDATSTETDDLFGLSLIPADNATGQGAWEQVRTSGLITTLAGSFANQIHGLVTESGGTVSLDFEGNGSIPGLGIWSDELVSVPIQSVVLDHGTDDAPTGNYVHVLKADPTVLVTNHEWPATEHIKVAYILCPSAAHVASEGVYINQNWNDGNEPNGMGHRTLMGENIRLTMDGAHWHSGVAANGATDGYITIVTGDTPDSAYFLSTAGVCYQMHKHIVGAKNTTSVDDIHVVNAFGAPYNLIHDIRDIEVDALNGSLTNRYYNIVFWMVANKSGEYAPVMMNMPTGSYVGLSSAIQDVDGFDVYDIPREFKEESSTGFLVCRITFRQTATAITVHNTTDLRGRTPGTASGTSIGGDAEFADNQFNIFNVLDNTKIVDLDLSGIVTGNTRTIEIPNADMIIPVGTLAGATELHYAGAKKLETSNTGATVTGVLVTDGVTINGAGEFLKFGPGPNIRQQWTGSLFKIQNDSGSVDLLTCQIGGEVVLFHDDVARVLTSATGATVAGTLVADGLTLGDDEFIQFGAGPDGRMYSNGSSIEITNGNGIKTMAKFIPAGAANLYYNNVKKFGTTATGATVTGVLIADGLTISNDEYLIFGAGDTSHLYSNGTDTFFGDNNPAVIMQKWVSGAGVELYYADVNVFKTTTTGILFGSQIEGQLIHDGTDLYIDNTQDAGEIILRVKDTGIETALRCMPGASVILYYNNIATVRTGNENFRPEADSTFTLGTNLFCWSNVYADTGISSCASDPKYKKWVQQTTMGLEFINELVPIAFKYNTEGKRPKNHLRVYQGFNAEDVETVLGNLGYTYEDFGGLEESFDEDGDRWLHLKYDQFIGPLVKAVQELSEKVATLEANQATNN